MKSLFKGLLRHLGLDLVRYAPDTLSPPQLLQLAVELEASKVDRFFFIQVGANDGRRDDPVHELIKSHGLHGLLVEPLPYFFEALQRHYADCAGLAFEQVAIARDASETTIYHLPHTGDTPDWAHGLASMDRGRLEAELAKHQWDSAIESTTVPAMTFGALREKHGIKDLNLLLIDTEGYDYEILSMAMESGLRPRIIQYEFLHLSPDDRIRAKRLLIASGYGVIDLEIDTLAIRND